MTYPADPTNPTSLKGKIAIITGGASGIGLGALHAFLAADVRGVTVVDMNQKSLDSVKAEVNDDNRLLTFQGDITLEETAIAYTKATVDKWGQVDIVVLNAGITGTWNKVHETSMEDYDKVMAVNQRGVFIGLKHGLRAFLASPSGGKGCSAIIISSIAGLEGLPLISPYTCAKFAVRGLTNVASQEYSGLGIRVNTICPGFIDTPFARQKPEVLDVAIEKSTMKRLGAPADIGNAALFLASDASGFCTGSTLKIDGGVCTFC